MALEQRLGELDEEYEKRKKRVKRTRQGIDNHLAHGGGGITITDINIVLV